MAKFFIFTWFWLVFLIPKLTFSATFLVNDLNDLSDQNLADSLCDASLDNSNQCTLRAAIEQANFNTDKDTIILDALEYSINLGELTITQSVRIEGKGAGLSTINADESSRIFRIFGQVDVDFVGLTIKKGRLNSGDAPAIKNENGNVIIMECEISENISEIGEGGAISNEGEMTILDSTIHSNTAAIGGGGAITNETPNSILIINNTTVSNNFALHDGGGIKGAGSINIINSTIAFNEAQTGGGISIGDIAIIKNSIIAQNIADINRKDLNAIVATFQSEGHNVIGVSNAFFSSQETDLTGTVDDPLSPQLDDVLSDNGGLTLTHALLPGSPAINQGDNENCPKTDQRGFGRPVDGQCDIGAFEFNAVPIACGDSIVQEDGGEECDDGNDDNEDQCSNECTINSNFSPEPGPGDTVSEAEGGCRLNKVDSSNSTSFLIIMLFAFPFTFKFFYRIDKLY